MYIADIAAPHFRFELVSPEKMEMGSMEQAVLLPAAAGEMTVLANHVPMLVELKPGIVALSRAAGTPPEEFFITGGFADINNEHCVVLTPQAIPLADLNRTQIETKIARLLVDLEAETDATNQSRIHQQLTLLHLQLTVASN
jgi:F-type H+-transporting ATPase subunit epsilon